MIPATKSQQLINETVRLINSEKALDAKTRSHLKREARAIIPHDKRAWEAIGMLATLERDKNEMIVAFKNANTGNPMTSANFATSYQRFFEFEKAIEQLDYALKKDPFDVEILKTKTNIAQVSGQFDIALDTLNTLKKLIPEDRDIQASIVVSSMLQSASKQHKRTDKKNATAFSFVAKFAESKGFIVSQTRIDLLQDEYDETLNCELIVDANIDDIIMLNIELAEAKAEVENGWDLFANGATFSFVSGEAS